MGLEFLDRSLRTTGILLLAFLPFGLYYMGIYPAIALFSGTIWGMLNLIFISALIRSVVRPGAVMSGRAIALAFFKFPVLYTSGYFLLKIPQFDPLYLVIGFSSIFAIITLRALGRMIVDSSDSNEKSSIHGRDVRSLV